MDGTGSAPDIEEFEFNECLSAVNKTRLAAKRMGFDLKQLRETFNCLDKVSLDDRYRR